MYRRILLVLPAAAALLLPAFSGPGDAPRSPQEFTKLLDTADRAFARKDYLATVHSLREGILFANGVLRDAIVAAMPVAPVGFTEIEMPKPRFDPSDPIGASMAMAADRPIEQRYRKTEGGGEVRVLVAPNSPTAPMVARAIALAAVEKDARSDVVEVGKWTGVLTMGNGDYSIRFLIGDVHIVEVRAFGIDPGDVLKRVDAAFLDAVAQVLGA